MSSVKRSLILIKNQRVDSEVQKTECKIHNHELFCKLSANNFYHQLYT